MAMTPDKLRWIVPLGFGGFGVIMLAVAARLVAMGEGGGAVAAGAFGLVFVGVGVLVWRVFRVPEGQKEVLVAERSSGSVSERRYVRVDASVPDAEVAAMQRRWAEEPWTQRGDWAEGRVVQAGGDIAGPAALIFIVVFNAIAWGFAAIFLSDDSSAWPVLLLPAGGLLMAVMIVRARIRQRKFGRSVIGCRTMPAWLGERFQGTVETGVPLRGRPSLEFRVRLRCLRRRTRTEYVNDRREERVTIDELWKHEERVRGVISSKGPTFQLPLDLALPDGMPSTELVPEDDRTLWQLELHAPDPGVDYDVVFELPVYARRAAAASGQA